MTSRSRRALLHAASAAPLPAAKGNASNSTDGTIQHQHTTISDGYTRRRRAPQQQQHPEHDDVSPAAPPTALSPTAFVSKAKQAELDLARQQIRTQEERILLLEQQLHAQHAAAEDAARRATHNQALLLNKLALLLSEDALHDWLLGVGMLEPEPAAAPAPAATRHKRKHDATRHTPHSVGRGDKGVDVDEQHDEHRQHKRRRRLFFGLL